MKGFLFMFFRYQGGEMLYARCLGLTKDVACPLKLPSSQATKSHLGKAKKYERKALNETMPMRRKKCITFSHTQHRTTPISTLFQPKERMRKRGDPHLEQKKVNKGKKTDGKLKDNKIIKLD